MCYYCLCSLPIYFGREGKRSSNTTTENKWRPSLCSCHPLVLLLIAFCLYFHLHITLIDSYFSKTGLVENSRPKAKRSLIHKQVLTYSSICTQQEEGSGEEAREQGATVQLIQYRPLIRPCLHCPMPLRRDAFWGGIWGRFANILSLSLKHQGKTMDNSVQNYYRKIAEEEGERDCVLPA